jgi:hypothetical protein
MEYKKIIAVTGLPGLYELLSSKTDGAIVRSLDDKSTRFVSSRIHNFSHLESIEIYTVRDNVNLVDVLKAMEASAEKLPDEKDNSSLKAYFTKVYPDMDFDRVYSSDLRKMVKWFAVLKANNIEITLPEPEEEQAPAEEAAEAPKDEATEDKSTATKDKSTVAKEKTPAAEVKEKPAAPKKKAVKAVKEEAEAKEKGAVTEEKPKPKKKPAAAEKEETADKSKKTTKKKS